jgi:hypothetical protein
MMMRLGPDGRAVKRGQAAPDGGRSQAGEFGATVRYFATFGTPPIGWPGVPVFT